MIITIAAIIFASALMLSLGTILAMIAPQWRRIVALASGQIEEVGVSANPLTLRRVTVRRWSAATAPMLLLEAA